MIIEVDAEDLRKLRQMIRDLSDQEKALYRSLKKTLGNMKTQSAKEIRRHLNLKAARVKKDLSAIGPNKSDLSARLRCKSRPVGLTRFGAKQNRKGVRVKVLKGGSSRQIDYAFIADLKNGNQQVVIRQTDMRGTEPQKPGVNYPALPHKYRLAIKVLYGPRVADWLARPEIRNPVERFAADKLSENIDREIMAILKGY